MAGAGMRGIPAAQITRPRIAVREYSAIGHVGNQPITHEPEA
jgi:hypothetical protein